MTGNPLAGSAAHTLRSERHRARDRVESGCQGGRREGVSRLQVHAQA